jgi:hypothetical protein
MRLNNNDGVVHTFQGVLHLLTSLAVTSSRDNNKSKKILTGGDKKDACLTYCHLHGTSKKLQGGQITANNLRRTTLNQP